MAGSSIEIDVTEVTNGLKNLNDTARAQLTVVADTVANNMKRYAKTEHPWTNRTYSAQNKLDAGYKWNDYELDIYVKHGVDYGYYLEKRKDWNGKYAILEKARDSEIDNFKNMVKNLNLGG